MEDFLFRAAADLHLGVANIGPTTWKLSIPGSLSRVFGGEALHVTTDKQLAALDPELHLLSPNSSLTLLIAEQLRSRGRPTHRARLRYEPEAAALRDKVLSDELLSGAEIVVGSPELRLLLRMVFRVRFEREVIEEHMLACCVDYERGTVWPALSDISALREDLAPLPPTSLTAEHVEIALQQARAWLERQLYPAKVRHEAELDQLLAVEQARINAFYDALKEDSGLALGARPEEGGASLEEERKRLLEEQEYRYALSLAAETVSIATIQAPVVPIGTVSRPELMLSCPLFAALIQPPRCDTCGRHAPATLHGEQVLCAICAQVA